jgi:L-cysteine S-thiosulfotransferase
VNVRTATYFASAALALAALTFGVVPSAVAADTPNPPADAKAFRDFFTQKFPKLKLEDFVNGPYSMNEDMHRQWEEKEQFPPYEFSVDMGKEMFSKPFKNGKSYADCFPNQGIGIRQNYPYFDDKEGKVVTLELALNRCREANGEAPFSYVKDEMAALTAYMAFTSRGKPFDIKIPNDPRALEAYQNGKRYFYTRRGQLNFSCATCHVQSPGERVRAEILAPALGILNAMPI